MTPSGQVIRPTDEYYIVALSAPMAERALVIKQGDTFAVFDNIGNIEAGIRSEEGLYHQGTRFLSHLDFQIAKGAPLLLSSTVRRDNILMGSDLTNPDLHRDGDVAVPRGTLHIYRTRFLWDSVCYERIRIRNFALTPHNIAFQLRYAADFADIFEVRGQTRNKRGASVPPSITSKSVTLGYKGLDGLTRRTRIEFIPDPDKVTDSSAEFWLELAPDSESVLSFAYSCEVEPDKPSCFSFGVALEKADDSARKLSGQQPAISTSNEAFNAWLERSRADLNMMITQTPYGIYPYAGVPWFSTPFGRDGIITALECLWMAPSIAKGVLSYLAATQATEISPEQDAEPGKILHETREGEMAALGEIPFGRYYGSIDSTPLFVMLAGAYYRRTGDLDFLKSIWPNIEDALMWMDRYGDADGDGFVEYFRKTPKGLAQQGWKDSHDSVFHADGSLAEGPIALCEVQGYVFRAKHAAADLASALGRATQAEQLRGQASKLQEHFLRDFWCDEIGMYALALDGKKHQCKVRTSNAGQCLFTGIASREHARLIASTLLGKDFYSGWGIRTVAENERRFNPMSYHNGSVWPHDNALVAAGFTDYQLNELSAQVLDGIFAASTFFDLHRLPELFCGFERRTGKGPTLYPVACNPQTWAAVSVFLLLQACVDLSIDAKEERIVFTRPVLPDGVDHLRIRGLRAGKFSADIFMFRANNAVALTVEKRDGPVEVLVLN